MRRLTIPLLILLFTYLSIVVFTNRALLFSRFDETYWKNKYEQSQWKLPLSIRTIGDDGLYLYEGYRLVHGADPTSSNAEMPPFGKYLIGISISLFGNGYIYGFLVTTGILIASYALAKKILKRTVPALSIVILLATDPLITNQYALTMMDALQALLLVLYFYFVFTIQSSHQPRVLVRACIAGVILGLFSVTKLPVLTPVLALSGGLYVWMTTKKPTVILCMIAGTILGYMVPYGGYFLHGHTMLDWLKIQKWMVSFYLHSNLTPTWGSAISVLFTGMYQNIFSRNWIRASEWSPTWGILMFSALTTLFIRFRTRTSHLQRDMLLVTLCVILVMYAGIPFWTRYFVVILPLLYIVGMERFILRLPHRARIGVCILLFTVNVASSIHILFPSPEATAQQYIYNAEHLVFRDLYEDTTNEFRRSMDRNTFEQMGFTTMAQGELEFIDITPDTSLRNRWESPQYLTGTATYFTRHLGSFTLPIKIPFVKEDGRWRIPWEWSLLLPGLDTSTHLETTVDEAKRGSIFGSDKKPLAQDVHGRILWITPGLTDKSRETELIATIQTLFDGHIPSVAIHQRFVGNTLSSLPIPIGVFPDIENGPIVTALSTFPGVTFTNALARKTYPSNIMQIGDVTNTTYPECCSMLYNTTAYNGTSGLEKTYNDILKGYNGGVLKTVDNQGNTIKEYIRVTKRDGKNVQL